MSIDQSIYVAIFTAISIFFEAFKPSRCYLSTCLSFHESIYLCISMVDLSIGTTRGHVKAMYLEINDSINLYFCQALNPSTCQSINTSLYLSIYQAIFLPIFLSITFVIKTDLMINIIILTVVSRSIYQVYRYIGISSYSFLSIVSFAVLINLPIYLPLYLLINTSIYLSFSYLCLSSIDDFHTSALILISVL